jgi:hypothetical protein
VRPNMPEMLSEAFKKQRDRSLDKQNVFENNLWKREKNRCSAAMPVNEPSDAHRRSVREVIKNIETTFKPTELVRSPAHVKMTNVEPKCQEVKKPTPMVSKLNVTLTKPVEHELPKLPSTLPWPNRSTSQSYVQKTIVRESYVTDMETSSGMDSTIGSTKKKLTTRVTVNMKKISRRSSDVEMFRRPCVKEECVRHSFGGSELARMVGNKPAIEEKRQAANSLTVAGSFGTPVGQKMVCCNCGSPQIVDLQNREFL